MRCCWTVCVVHVDRASRQKIAIVTRAFLSADVRSLKYENKHKQVGFVTFAHSIFLQYAIADDDVLSFFISRWNDNNNNIE